VRRGGCDAFGRGGDVLGRGSMRLAIRGRSLWPRDSPSPVRHACCFLAHPARASLSPGARAP
jgi:hypothetical protein